MKHIRLGLSLILAAFMTFMGSQKFGETNPVFSYIAAQSGIELFEPTIRLATGIAELAAAILILLGVFLGMARGLGALLSLAVIGGAILFHLTPWLGINAPVAFAEEGGYVHSPMLFGMAVVFGLISAYLVLNDRPAILGGKAD
jgi:hypothetical protein